MTDEQKYLFDINGYLIIENVLTRDRCQRLIDAVYEGIATPNEELPKGVRHASHFNGTDLSLGDLTSIGPIFADLIDLRTVLDVLHAVIHSELRLENTYARVRRKGDKGLDLHGGGHWDGGGQDRLFLYRHFNGEIFAGNTVVTFNLTDVSEDEGGFLCVPGSHKANFRMPESWRDVSSGQFDPNLVRSVPCSAGSVVIFPEALCHGASPWSSDRDRVNLFYKYNHVGMKFRDFYPTPDALKRMTPNQRGFYTEVASDSRSERVIFAGRPNSE